MDDPLLVRLFERLRDLQRETEALLDWKRPGLEALGERRTGDQLHDEGMGLAAGLEAVDLGDVRVVQLREELRLAFESCQPFFVFRERRRQHLDRHLALEPGVRGAPDLAHATLAELGRDLVRTEAGAGGGRGCVGHGRSTIQAAVRVPMLWPRPALHRVSLYRAAQDLQGFESAETSPRKGDS